MCLMHVVTNTLRDKNDALVLFLSTRMIEQFTFYPLIRRREKYGTTIVFNSSGNENQDRTGNVNNKYREVNSESTSKF